MLMFLKVQTFHMRTFYNLQSAYLLPAIESVWSSEQRAKLEGVTQPLKLGGDARCCSPGHTAKHGSFTLMDLQTSRIMDMQLVQSNEVENSNAMELERLKRCLNTLDEAGVTILDLTSDRHPQVKKFLREQRPYINHWYGVWHVAKDLRAVSTITYVPNTIGYSRISNVTFKPRGDQQSQPQDVTKNSPNVENVEKSVEDKYGPAVVILTYMRSGSSLVGDILQQSPGAFYVFEPFRAMWHAIMKANYTLEYMDGTTRKSPVDFIAESVDNLRQWLTCNTSQMYKEALHDDFLKYGKKSSTFKPCVTKEVKANKTRNEAMKICADKLQTLCRESPIRIIKTIRLPMMSLAPLLEEIPGLKVLHLVRDPRPTLASQKYLGQCRPGQDGGDEGCTNRQCSQVENNILQQEELTKKYPGRLKTVTYESIAGKPLDASRKMYTFLGTTFSKHAEEYIYNITLAGKEDNCIICTTRKNSTEHVDRWKKSMKPEFIKIVQRRCNYILQHFGYELLPLNETTKR